MNEEKRITYQAGITRTPSDFLCKDGELAECINLATDHEELKPIVQPAVVVTGAKTASNTDINPTILLIHKFNEQERYVGYIPVIVDGENRKLVIWGIIDDGVFRQKGYLTKLNLHYLYCTDDDQFSTVGKTLIYSGSQGMYYFLWTYDNNNNPTYEALGDSFERPNVSFMLSGRNNNIISEQITCRDMLYSDGGVFKISLGKQADWNNAVTGLYLGLRRKVWQKKKFHSSFCVRAALELYDGSYYHISNPILMVNHFAAHGVAQIYDSGLCLTTMEQAGQELQYWFSQDYSKWSDIVKNVVLFVTREFDLFDTNVDCPCTYNGISGGDPRFYFMSGNAIYSDPKTTTTSDSAGDTYTVLASNPDSDLDNTLKDGIYYKLCEIGLTGDSTWHDASDHFDTHTIENITSQDRITEDDFYSHCPMKAGMLYSYNSRLNMANVARGFFGGFDNFMPFDGTGQTAPTYEFLVTIRTDGGDRTVSHTWPTYQKQGIYFYYPDPRARHVVIKKNGTQILNVDLKEHPTLNGAYYFAGISPTMDEPTSASGTIPTVSSDAWESLPNYILQSEVNNPFVFKSTGYFKVGTGKILAMSTITQALSQGQFGQFPLLVFSESGIWALSVGKEGVYEDIHPMSRDVCINPKNILQTDGAVFFVSKKGLMVVDGNVVRCVSEQMNGKVFSYTGDLEAPLAHYALADDGRVVEGVTHLPTSPTNNMLIGPHSTFTEGGATYQRGKYYEYHSANQTWTEYAGSVSDWWPLVLRCSDSTTFLNFIRDSEAFMAYDYIDSRIIITKANTNYAYVYSIADGSISKMVLPHMMNSAVNNYPDYLLQGMAEEQVSDGQGGYNTVFRFKMYSFYQKPREEEVNDFVMALLLTRPMKLAGPVSQSSLRQLVNVGMWNDYSNPKSLVKTEVFLSSDLQKWYNDRSRFGAAARYYRLALYIKMKPTERLSGTIIADQERRGNNMRRDGSVTT